MEAPSLQWPALATALQQGAAALVAHLSAGFRAASIPAESLLARLEGLGPFLEAHPAALASCLSLGILDTPGDALAPLLRAWSAEAPRPWLRAVSRLAHGEAPMCLEQSLCLAPGDDLLLVNGMRGELWSLARGVSLWRSGAYLGERAAFTADARFLVVHGNDTAGMTDDKPYTLVLDAQTGAQVFADTRGQAEGALPSAPPGVAPRPAFPCERLYDDHGKVRAWRIGGREAPWAWLPGTFVHLVAAEDGRRVIGIAPGWITVFAVER